ncbi:hypothetical protein BR93DRAFT_990593 [Coniochaeta sp. PMI_546]|nr:hypothetical protein BR93DRAFT_990593 [Coniochaeta sp. PMI_546]
MSSETFSIAAAPGTDVWRKPPSTDIYNAPTHPPPSGSRTKPLKSFISARISFSFPFTTAAQYDQGGLLLSFHPTSGSRTSAGSAPPPRWIKTGVEYYNSAPRLSTVSCETYADWSVGDRTPDSPTEGTSDKVWTTVAVEKQGDHHGPSFWVFRVLEDGTKVPLREITWIYAGGDEEVAKWDLTVEALAARPDKEVTSDLVVEFKDFTVEWAA